MKGIYEGRNGYVGVFDQEEGGDGYDVEVYNEYDNSSLPNRGGTSRYATTVVEIDDDDDTLIGDRGHHSAEVGFSYYP